MPTYRYATLLLSDAQGQVTAALIEDPEVAAIGPDEGSALAEVERHLALLAKRAPWRLAEPELESPSIAFVTVPVRAEHARSRRDDRAAAGRRSRRSGRVRAAAEVVPVRVACVVARRKDGGDVVHVPFLELSCELSEPGALKDTVTRLVTARLGRLAPVELLGLLAPDAYALAEASVRVPARPRARRSTDLPETLAEVAEPIGALGGLHALRAFERDVEVQALARRLEEPTVAVALVGPTGAGKTAVLAEAARRVARSASASAKASAIAGASAGRGGPDEAVPRVWFASAAGLIAGMRYLGQWEARLEKAIGALQRIEGILCVESLLELVRVGGRGPGDSVAQFLVPYLQAGELKLVGEATAEELDACRRLLPGFADLLTPARLDALEPREATRVVERTLASGAGRGLTVDAAVAPLIVSLYQRFMPYRALPGPAVALARELSTSLARDPRKDAIAPGDAIALFARQSGLPEALLRDEHTLTVDAVEQALAREVIGQPRACRLASELVVQLKAGLQDPDRPVGVLLLVGPTGTGKTQLAKALARYLYGAGDDGGAAGRTAGGAAPRRERLIRLDMSEYAMPGAADRLIGRAGGEPGELVEKLRAQPFSVVLLDEVEKAAPEVFDALLGAFDEGRLTDAYGRVTSLKSAFILLTSNLGAERADQNIGFGAPSSATYAEEAASFFRPELLNRLDGIVRFDALSPAVARAIVDKELAELQDREGFARAGLRLEVTDALRARLFEEGFDRRYGARPLQRAIEERVALAVARLLVAHPGLRDCTVRVALAADGSTMIEVIDEGEVAPPG